MTLGFDGNFYGTTGGSGSGFGTVFKVTYNRIFSVLHTFSGTDGSYSEAPLVVGNNGNLYGTTYVGGSSDNGTVFMITTNGTFTNLHDFNGVDDGGSPWGAMVQAPDGNLYGTTYGGGAGGGGTVFMISPGGHTFRTLHYFTGGSDGGSPHGPLVVGTDGNLYGTTAFGGASNSGVIFEITPQGVLTVLHSFDTPVEGGRYPTLMQHTSGVFYGTTYADGTSASGTVFSLSKGLGPFVTTVPSGRGIGEKVLILGQRLTGATLVTFNGVSAAFTVNSDTEITATVPASATKGFVQVTTPSGTLSTKVIFLVP